MSDDRPKLVVYNQNGKEPEVHLPYLVSIKNLRVDTTMNNKQERIPTPHHHKII